MNEQIQSRLGDAFGQELADVQGADGCMAEIQPCS